MSYLQRNFMLFGFWLMLLGVAHSESGWTGINEIQELRAPIAGRSIIIGDMKMNPSECKDSKSFYLDFSMKRAQNVYLLLLQSIATKNPVKLYVTGRCDIHSRSEISSAAIFPSEASTNTP